MEQSIEELIGQAKSAGFTAAAEIDVSKIELKDEVRAMCAADKCRAYGNNWTCPPNCGTLDECRERIGRYSVGIILQTTGLLEDSMDYEAMMETGKVHKRNMTAFLDTVREVYPGAMGLGAGGCGVCEKCAYPDPCRFPDKAMSSMEGYGMVVSEVCTAAGLPYYYGKNTITYVGCCFLY